MKDLLVLAADADAEAFLRAVLSKPRALGIRPVTCDIKRHSQRDSGMVQSGAELVRMQKGRYGKTLLLWDHHGSGRDREEPDALSILSGDRSGVAGMVPLARARRWRMSEAAGSALSFRRPSDTARKTPLSEPAACGSRWERVEDD